MIKRLLLKLFNIYPNIISFKEIIDLTGFPIITFWQKGRKLHFLLDTGSNDNIIDSDILKKLDHEMLEEERVLSGLDGIENKAKTCNLTLSYKSQEYPFTYLVNDMAPAFSTFKKEHHIQLAGIIGVKFFQKYKYVLDFADMIAYSKK